MERKKPVVLELSKPLIERTPLPESGQTFLWDSELTGFGIRFTPGSKTYIVQNRVKGVKQRRVSLGRHGEITLQEARKRAKKMLGDMVGGFDPSEERKRAVAYSETLKRLSEKYIAARPDLRPATIHDINKHISTTFSAWADKPVLDITREKVKTLFLERSRTAPTQTNQAFRILRAIMNFARETMRTGEKSLMPENPVQVLSAAKIWNKTRARSGKIPVDKVGMAWNLIRDGRNTGAHVNDTAIDIVSFFLLTGARWGEAAELTWDRVNLQEGAWYVDPKNREPKTFPLSQAAIGILEARRHRKDQTGYVFPGRSEGHITSAHGIFDKVTALIGALLSPHDCRRTFRSIAGECGIEFWKTKLLMGHKISGDVTLSHYTETADLTYLRKEIDMIGAWIIRQSQIAASPKVISMKGRQGA